MTRVSHTPWAIPPLLPATFIYKGYFGINVLPKKNLGAFDSWKLVFKKLDCALVLSQVL